MGHIHPLDPSALETLFRIAESFFLGTQNVTALFSVYCGLLICMENIHWSFC